MLLGEILHPLYCSPSSTPQSLSSFSLHYIHKFTFLLVWLSSVSKIRHPFPSTGDVIFLVLRPITVFPLSFEANTFDPPPSHSWFCYPFL